VAWRDKVQEVDLSQPAAKEVLPADRAEEPSQEVLEQALALGLMEVSPRGDLGAELRWGLAARLREARAEALRLGPAVEPLPEGLAVVWPWGLTVVPAVACAEERRAMWGTERFT
jgi:hypothetical protein